MIHLKRFNESLGSKERLQNFCDMYLSYLIDDGFKVEIISEDGLEHIHLIKPLIISGRTIEGKFSWDNIKDRFIPFLKMLKLNYHIEESKIISTICFDIPGDYKAYHINKVLKDSIKENYDLFGVWIYNIRGSV